jgi:hypothetical protein
MLNVYYTIHTLLIMQTCILYSTSRRALNIYLFTLHDALLLMLIKLDENLKGFFTTEIFNTDLYIFGHGMKHRVHKMPGFLVLIGPPTHSPASECCLPSPPLDSGGRHTRGGGGGTQFRRRDDSVVLYVYYNTSTE